MNNNINIISMVDYDINNIKNTLEKYQNDRNKIEKLFYDIFFRYVEKIENISSGLSVISPYSDELEINSIYAENIIKLLQKLELFRDNGYSNENLFDFYVQSEHIDEIDTTAKISDIIISIGLMNTLSDNEKDEISQKLREIEEISSMNETKVRRWEKLRPYVLWVSGKDYNVAIKILPLFLRLR